MTAPTTMDRPAAIRRALRDLVAERGFHGASMSAIARAAGVATGTAYVHYESKDELVFATYLEIKRDLSAAVLGDYDAAADPRDRYAHIMSATHRHLAEEPARARFLTQLEESPYYAEAHERLLAEGDPLVDAAQAPDIAGLLAPLPQAVIYALSLGVVVRLIASGQELSAGQLDEVVDATWRAIASR